MSKKANRFYVYIHTRNDTGEVFYVGKGSGDRFKSTSSRNQFWVNFTSKYQWNSKKVQQNMLEEDAFLLEMWLIAKFRNDGLKLCNLTDGGEGPSGIESSCRKVVYCSNGMSFESTRAAADWCKVNGYPKASDPHISACSLGKLLTAYGHAWSYESTPEPPKFHGRPSIHEAARLAFSVPVETNCGMKFGSLTEAQDFLKKNGHPKASFANISTCASGKRSKAYGYGWAYSSYTQQMT